MADINFGILDTQMPGRIAAIPQQQQAQQAQNAMQLMQVQQTMQQNALAKAKMEEYTRGTAEKNALRGRMTQPGFDIYDPKQQAEIMGLSPELASPIIQHALKVRQTESATNKTNFELTGLKIDRAKLTIAAARNPEEASAAINKSQTAGDIDAADADLLRKKLGDSATFAEEQKNMLDSMTSAKDRLERIAPKPRVPNPAADLLIPGPNGTLVPNTALIGVKGQLATLGRAPAAPRPEQPPVAVVDPATGKTVYVSREEALSQRMTPANAGEGLPPKEIQKRESVYPTATSAVKGFESKSEAFIKDLKALRNHPGLPSITGIAAGRLPGVTAEGRAAQALYDKVVAKGGFQALQDLRDASKTGGALGNVSNREGQQLTASFAAIDRRQDAPDVQAAIDGAIAGVEGARIRTREAYDDTYSYKSPAGQTAPSPAAATIPQAAIDALNAGKGTPAEFDAQFGAGAAARVKGKR